MKTFLYVILSLLIASHLACAAEIRFTREGAEINAGSIGQFTLEYPELLDAAQQPAQKLQEKNAAGKYRHAQVVQDGGAQIDLAVGEGGKIAIKS